MRLEIRDFRIPIVLTALMLGVITYWAWQTWHRLDDHEIGRAQREAIKISDILASTLRVFDQNGQLSRDEIEQQFSTILNASHYQFLILEQDSRRILQVGTVPTGLPSSFEENAFFFDGTFIFSRRVSLPKSAPREIFQNPSSGSKSDGLGITDGDYLLVLGRDNRQDHMPPQKLAERIIVPFVAVLLILSANAAAWVMVIRNRSLFEQLEIERTRSAHLEDLGLAAAGLAHETKNPLGIISGIAQQVARDPQVPEQSRVMIETIIDEIDKSVSRLGLFMTFARQRRIHAVPVDARQVIKEIAGVLQPEFDAAGVYLKIECPTLTILADEDMFRQILVNLILNSLTASSPENVITIHMQRNGSHASVMVKDQGCGISKDLLPRIFKPYVTGNPNGHGLGLSIVKRFVEDHGWSIAVASRRKEGTMITVSRIFISEKAGDAK